MKKTSVGRSSKQGPVRLSNRNTTSASIPLDLIAGSSAGGQKRPKSNIPLPKFRSSSTDRDSRSRLKTVESSKKRRSKSHATPTTPALQCLMPFGYNSAQSTMSRTGSKCSSVDRGYKGHKGKSVDPRPLNDKGFQNRAMLRIFEYFQMQPQAIRNMCPAPSARSIMIKSFVDIMGHLLTHFFGNHGVYIKNYIEEIPKLLKKLYYPGNVSSSWLKTVNAPHAWPYVVGVMSWLVDLIVLREKNLSIDDYFPQYIDAEDVVPCIDPKIVFMSTLKSFDAWNREEDAKVEEINKALIADLKEMQGFTDGDILELQVANAELLEQLNDPAEKSAIDKYENYVDYVNGLTAKEEDMKNTAARYESSIQTLNLKLEEVNLQHKKLLQELKSKESKLAHIEQVVASQSISTNDAKAIAEEINQYRREITNNNAYMSELGKIKCADDMKLAAIKSKLNVACVEYNKEILPSSFANSLMIRTNLNFHERDLEKAVLEMGKIDDGLKQLKEDLTHKIKSTDSDFEKHEKDIKRLKDQNKNLIQKAKLLTKELPAQVKLLKDLEAEMEKMEIEFNTEYSAIRTENEQLVKSMPDIQNITAQLKESVERETKQQQDFEQMVSQINEFFREQRQLFTAHKKEVLQGMATMNDSSTE